MASEIHVSRSISFPSFFSHIVLRSGLSAPRKISEKKKSKSKVLLYLLISIGDSSGKEGLKLTLLSASYNMRLVTQGRCQETSELKDPPCMNMDLCERALSLFRIACPLLHHIC